MFRNYKYNILANVDLHLVSEQIEKNYRKHEKNFPLNLGQ